MVNKTRKIGWIASGVLAASLFAAASPAQAQVRRGFGPRVSHFRTSRAFVPRVRYSRFYRPYYYAASPYYYDDYYYAARPYYSGYYARPYYYGRPYVSFRVGPRVGFRGHFRGRW